MKQENIDPFLFYNKKNLIKLLFDHSLKSSTYHLTYQIAHYMIKDLEKINYFTSIDNFIETF